MIGILIMTGSIIISTAVIVITRPDKTVIKAGFITGIIITVLNMLLEWAGASLDIYYVNGPLPVMRTPLPLFIAWIFLTSVYCTAFSLFVRGDWTLSRGWLFIMAGIIAGWLFDFSAWRFLSILRLGENGNAVVIGVIWIVFMPLTLVIYSKILKLIRSS